MNAPSRFATAGAFVFAVLSAPAAANSTQRLLQAVMNGDTAAVNRLAGNGWADVNARNRKGETLLEIAVWYKKDDAAKALLAHGADPNLNDNQALATAASRDNADIVSALVQAGADPNAGALFSAANRDAANAIEALIAGGANPNTTNEHGGTPLHSAAGSRGNAALKALIAAGADIEGEDDNGRTPLFAAVAGSNAMAVRALLRKRPK